MKIMDFGKAATVPTASGSSSSAATATAATSVEQALRWTAFFDQCESAAYRSGHFELTAYHPFGLLAYHRLFASRTAKANLSYPRQEFEVGMFVVLRRYELSTALATHDLIILRTSFLQHTHTHTRAPDSTSAPWRRMPTSWPC
jgi:hypothetical protein